MQTGIFLEYNSYVDGIKTRLMNLYNKRQRCHFLLENDYQAGLISQEDYDYICKSSKFNYDERIPAKYQLSKEELEYLRTYGRFNDAGFLLLDMVTERIAEKQKNFNCIEKSIRIFYQYDNLDEKRRKDLLIEEISQIYDSEIARCKEEISGLKASIDDKYYSLNLKRAKAKLRLIKQEKEKLIADVLASNYRQFMQIVELFYGIKFDFYNWYKRRYVKEECEREIRTIDQESQIDAAKGRTVEVSENLGEARRLSEEIADITNLIINLTSELVRDSFDEKSEKKKGIFKRKSKTNNTNQDDLRNIFSYYSRCIGFMPFIRYFIESNDEDLAMIFTKYYAKVYGSCTYVEPYLFKKRLVLEMINYFQETIDKKNEQLKSIMKLLSSDTDMLSDQMGEIRAHESVRNYYQDNQENLDNVDAILLELGFSVEEITRMYEDMRKFIETNLTKEYLEGPILNLKVGN